MPPCYRHFVIGQAFIYRFSSYSFRTSNADTLELVEESLDINLLNNAVRLKVFNCSILPGGVHVCETQSNVIILILTNLTVHRLVLPHPSRLYRSVSVTGTRI